MTYCSTDVACPDVIVPMVTHRRGGSSIHGRGGGGAPRGGGVGAAFHCHRARLNGLWSLWYCVGVVAFHVYLTVASIQRFAAYIALPWPEHSQPYFELNAYVGFVGAAVVLAPFFVVAAILKVGNLANDGHQLGSAADVHVLDPAPHQPLGLIRTVWLHSGPTAPLLHLIAAFCLLLPKVLMQAQLIRHGFLPKGELWRTDLDFMLTYKDRIVVWSFLASNNLTTPPTLSSNTESVSRDYNSGDRLHDSALISPEFVNYALALLVYAVRYPSVFWATNKPLSLLFSTQLVLNALQSLLAFTGFAVLYKLRCYGPQAVLPPGEPFLMGVGVALALYVAYAMAVTACGSVVYLYAFQKYKAYVAREREKHHISWRAGSHTLWGYLPHCIALAILMALASTSTPLTYDAMLVYRGNLDGAILACVIGTVMHLFLWIVLWLFLTLKNHWRFRVDPGDGRLARQLGNLEMSRLSSGSSGTPLVVLSDGQTFAVHEASPRAAIMNIVEKTTGGSGGSSHRSSRGAVDHSNDDDDIYWLKPKPTVPKETADTRQPSWLARRKASPAASKPKVLFEDSLRGGSPRRVRAACTKSPKIGKVKKQNVKFEDLTDSEDDDGDYATLRDLPLVREEEEPEEGKELHNKAGETDADSDADETQTLLLGRRDPHSVVRISPATHQAVTRAPVTVHPTKGDIGTPTLPTPQSVSSSPSPPGKCSDTSSGVHSSSSMSDNHSRRSSSVDEMTTVGVHPRLISQPCQPPQIPAWRSLSLQRTGVPPAPQQILARRGSATLERSSTVSDTAADDPDGTLVIRRKAGRLKSGEPGRLEPFGRATNMRMTSFTDQPDFPPEQGVGAWHKMGLSSTVPGHRGPVPWQLQQQQQQQQRDSANYSLTSSGDSDSYLSHQS